MRWMRPLLLAALLATTLILVPDAGPAPTRFSLVKMERSDGVDVDPDTVWVLAVGSDARPGQNPLRSRGDALQLVGMNTETGAATTIGIPRDSWVPIPGVGSNRVNAALYFGGPQLLGRTVGNLVGIQPDYVMVAPFWGLRAMIDEIGGITVDSPRAFSDPYLRPEGFEKGENRLFGYGVVAFGRIRKSLPGGDFERSANQQRVLRGIRARVAEQADRPGFVESGVLSVLKHLDTDASPAELFRIAQAIAQVDPRRISACVVPGGIGNVGGASVVLPNTATAQRYGDDARKDATIKRC